jgi:hypothetical protein
MNMDRNMLHSAVLGPALACAAEAGMARATACAADAGMVSHVINFPSAGYNHGLWVAGRVAHVQHAAGHNMVVYGHMAGVPCRCLVDTGASHSFIDAKFAREATLTVHDSAQPLHVSVAGGVQMPLATVVKGQLKLKHALTDATLTIMPNMLQGVDIILGMDWLKAHKAHINIGDDLFTVEVHRKTHTFRCAVSHMEDAMRVDALQALRKAPRFLSAKQAKRALHNGCRSWLIAVQPVDTTNGACDTVGMGCMGWTVNVSSTQQHGMAASVHAAAPQSPMPQVPKATGSTPSAGVGTSPSSHSQQVLDEIAAIKQSHEAAAPGMDTVGDGEVGPEYMSEVKKLLAKFADVFAPLSALPKNKAVYSVIPTEVGAPPPYRKSYRMSENEKQEVTRQVEDLLAMGYIEPSNSPYGAPVLFVQKKDGTLRMCIDYRQLNKITIRDRYPLPRIEDLLDMVGKNRIFSSLDLQSGYHQMLLPEVDVPKTAFVTDRGQYQFKVLCFGLTNAPSAFQRLMHTVFSDMIGKFLLCYLDDLLVVSNSPQEHLEHLKLVLERLRAAGLYAKLSKCEWAKLRLKFVGHVVGGGQVAMDPSKLQVLRDWPVPKDLHGLRGFLGLANYFRKFIRNFSTVAHPLTDLTSSTRHLAYSWDQWKEPELRAFQALKYALTHEPVVLTIPDTTKPYTVMSDASIVGCGAVLLQEGRVIAYTSHKFSPAESRYPTQDQEALGIVRALQDWRCYLEGAVHVVCLTDHKPLMYLTTQAILSRRQTRWLEFLSRFNFDIKYQRGVDNPVADALSRHSGVLAPLVLDQAAFREAACLPLLHPCCLAPVVTRRMLLQDTFLPGNAPRGEVAQPKATKPSTIITSNTRATAPPPKKVAGGRVVREHLVPGTMADALRYGYAHDTQFADHAYTDEWVFDPTGVWLHSSGKIVVPDSAELKKRIMHEHHDTPAAGHRGITKTVELVQRTFWWPGLRADVTNYVQSCNLCQRMKAGTRAKAGLLQPLPIPEKPWDSVSMDLITGLPVCKQFDSILVFVDRLTKYALFVPTTSTLNAEGFAQLFVDHVFKTHGTPLNVVSDRGAQFHNQFWEHVCKLLQVANNFSSAYHPESDGQTERMNRILEDVLRHYITPDQCDWMDWLSLAQFAVNNSWQESVKHSPFFLNHGYDPRLPSSVTLPIARVPRAGEFVDRIHQAISKAKKCLLAAQERMRANVDKHRRPVSYVKGDMVLLNTVNFRVKGGGKKLMPKWVGPFEVESMVGKAAVKLHWSEGYERMHNVFHVSLVKPYKVRPGEEAVQARPLAWLGDEGEPAFEVDAIVAHQCKAIAQGRGPGKRKTGRFRITAFLVKWKGFGVEHNTWEPVENMDGCKELVAAYRDAHGLLGSQYS